MNAFQFICQYIRRHRLQYVLGILTLFFVDYANIFIPKLTGVITDGLTAHSMDWGDVKKNLLYLFLLGLSLAVGRFFWRYFLFGASRSIEKELRNDMFAHLEKMDVEYYNEHKTGDLMTRFTSDLNAIRMAIGPAVISVFDASVMTFMVIFQMMYYVSVKLFLFYLGRFIMEKSSVRALPPDRRQSPTLRTTCRRAFPVSVLSKHSSGRNRSVIIF